MTKKGLPKGFSLIELMIAMVLGLLLIGVVIQLFSGTRLTYQSNEALARVQETGRFAMETLRREIRSLGGDGFCAGEQEITSHLDTSCAGVDVLFDTNSIVRGWEYQGTGIGGSYSIPTTPAVGNPSDWVSQDAAGLLTLPGFLLDPDDGTSLVVEGTDVLMVRGMQRLDVDVDGWQNNTNIQLNSGSIPQRALVLVTDCQGTADIFQQSNKASPGLISKPAQKCNAGLQQPGNMAPGSSPWSIDDQYDETTQVFVANTRAYFIGISQQSGNPALFQIDPLGTGSEDADPAPVELVDGVENLQIIYGVSGTSNGRSVEQWYPAHQVPNWNLVIAARLAVVVSSNQRADRSDIQEQFFSTGTTITAPADSRLRREYSSVIALRNRVVVDDI